MPDTGLPWEIPYIEPADLVRDYPAADEAQALAIAAGLTAAGNAGIGSNVVSVVKDDTFTTTSTSYTDVTGLAVTITPTSATAKVLVTFLVNINMSNESNGYFCVLTDGANNILFAGAAAGVRTRAIWGSRANADVNFITPVSAAFLWSPASATAVTAKIRVRIDNTGSLRINRDSTDNDATNRPRLVSNITAIEVEA
jgi:hypothetical protein